jgi:hypothetical protein
MFQEQELSSFSQIASLGHIMKVDQLGTSSFPNRTFLARGSKLWLVCSDSLPFAEAF